MNYLPAFYPGENQMKPTEQIATPSIGRIVHYVDPDGNWTIGQHWPAIVLEVCDNIGSIPEAKSMVVDLTVFTSEGMLIRERVGYSPQANKERGTWHWPERTE